MSRRRAIYLPRVGDIIVFVCTGAGSRSALSDALRARDRCRLECAPPPTEGNGNGVDGEGGGNEDRNRRRRLEEMACRLNEEETGMLDASVRQVRLRWLQLLHER